MKKRKFFKAYLPFTLNVFQREISYRMDTLIFIIGEAIMLAVTYFLWKAVYGNSPKGIIKGFSFYEMSIYILISFLTSLLSMNISEDIAIEVVEGSIAMELIKPINYEKRMFFTALGSLLHHFILFFVPGFIAVTLIFNFISGKISILNIFLYFISLILGLFLNFFYSYCMGLLSFKIYNIWGLFQVNDALMNIFSGTLIPLSFFPAIMQKAFNFLPYKSMVYAPVMIYLGKLSNVDILNVFILQIIWIFILMGIARLLWKVLIKQLTILGG